MWIQNVSLADVVKGNHKFDSNTALIQIQDYGTWQFAKPARDFVQTIQLKFDDHDDPTRKTNITTEQAEQIATFLDHCKKHEINVVVHCHAGICRSGAVAEVGTIIGFTDTGMHRIPNVLVKTRILKALGITNSWD